MITGAGSGIGRALAVELGQRGAIVVAVDIADAQVSETAAAVVARGGQASAYVVDVSDAGEVWKLADEIRARHGGADIVVNNAAIAGEFKTMAEQVATHGPGVADRIRRLTDVNLLGVAYGTAAFLPQLLERPTGVIVNVASEAGIVPYPGCAPYSMTKFGVRGFTEALQMGSGAAG